MTTAELIRQLQEADPEGTTEVVIGNAPVIYVDREPAYYDGRMQRFVVEDGKVVRAEIVSSGEKVCIERMSISDRLWDFPDMPVEYNGCEQYRQGHDDIRKASRDIEYKVALDTFTRHVRTRYADVGEQPETVKDACRAFFDEHYGPNHSMPDDIRAMEGKSWVERRGLQYEREVKVSADCNGVVLKRR